MLRNLAGASRQVPKSYLIGTFTRYQVSKDIFASGGFADIREGKLKGKVVAIKTIRTSLETKVDEVLEVCKGAACPILVDRLTYRIQTFCKECVLWMNIYHPNILQLIAVKIKPGTCGFSMISEFMANGNILNYIRVNEANRLRLVRPLAANILG